MSKLLAMTLRGPIVDDDPALPGAFSAQVVATQVVGKASLDAGTASLIGLFGYCDAGAALIAASTSEPAKPQGRSPATSSSRSVFGGGERE